MERIKQLQFDVEIIDANDYVLRRYPPSKSRNLHKYGSWWRGPYQITHLTNRTSADLVNKPDYAIRNFVTNKEYKTL